MLLWHGISVAFTLAYILTTIMWLYVLVMVGICPPFFLSGSPSLLLCLLSSSLSQIPTPPPHVLHWLPRLSSLLFFITLQNADAAEGRWARSHRAVSGVIALPWGPRG